MEAYDAIITRRSTRKYSEVMPDRELIEKVITAGRYAPSGHNNQTTHFLVFTNKSILAELTEIVKQEFAEMEITEDMYISMKNAVNASKKGVFVFHYNAPVLIVTANQKGYGNAVADSACALENMMIMANSLDLGSCWINQLHWLDEHAAVRDILEELGLRPDEAITGGLILGFGLSGEPNRDELPRTGNPVTWIE